MKKCTFIVPYFGKLPDSFPVFLKTCSFNKKYDWLVFTDDKRSFDYPENVIRIDMTFEDVKKLAQSKFDFPICLDQPYKLCDYKPAYGYIFEEYIAKYPFWGHCDLDTIMGNLDKLIDDDLYDKYDKLFCLGHMILYRNSYDNNRAFMEPVGNRLFYKESFTTDKITAFDETWDKDTSVNTVFIENGKSVFMEDWSVNFKILPTAFVRVRFNPEKYNFDVYPKQRELYVWDKGNILRYSVERGVLNRHEELYMHFQQRKMRYDIRILDRDKFAIVPNRFVVSGRDIKCIRDFRAESRYRICFHYFEVKLERLKKRVKDGKI